MGDRTIRRSLRALLLVVALVAGAVTPVQAVAPGTVTGTVRVPGGYDVTAVTVAAYDLVSRGGGRFTWERTETVGVETDGTYALELPEGNHRIGFEGSPFDRLPLGQEFHGGATDPGLAAPVTVRPGAVVAGVDAVLAVGARLSGRLTDETGAPVRSGQVTAYRFHGGASPFWDGTNLYADTADDGTYEFRGLAAGTYRLSFAEGSVAQHLPEFHDDAVTFDGARDVALGRGQARPGLDASVQSLGDISGRVTGPTGVDLTGVVAEVYAPDGVGWKIVHRSSVRADGRFGTRDLPAAVHRIGFRDTNGRLATTFYDGADTVASAADLDLKVGSQHNVNALMLAAVVTPPPPPPPPPGPPPAPKVVKLAKAPKVTGKARVGKTLKVTRGAWKPGTVTVKYQWFVKKGKRVVALKKATKPSLKLVRSLRGKKVRVRVTASAPGRTAYVFTSRWSAPVKR